jgi:hypothetical protein
MLPSLKHFSIVVLFILFTNGITHAQVDTIGGLSTEVDTITDVDTAVSPSFLSRTLGVIPWHNLPFVFDDIMVVGGINQSGLHFSNQYRELSTIGGWQLGAEGYYPIGERLFLVTGAGYAQSGMQHAEHDVRIRFHQINVPVLFAYELPVLRSFEWRLFLGTQFSYTTSADQSGVYPEDGMMFRYNIDDINRMGFGFTFGLSWEHRDFYLRLRGYMGMVKRFTNLHPETQIGDTGMMQTFQIEFGYFLFRPLREF